MIVAKLLKAFKSLACSTAWRGGRQGRHLAIMILRKNFDKRKKL